MQTILDTIQQALSSNLTPVAFAIIGIIALISAFVILWDKLSDKQKLRNFYKMPPSQLEELLTNSIVTYVNSGVSTVKVSGIRNFLVESIETDAFSAMNKRYLVAATRDLDDGGERKFRTLQVAGISNVRSRWVAMFRFFL